MLISSRNLVQKRERGQWPLSIKTIKFLTTLLVVRKLIRLQSKVRLQNLLYKVRQDLGF
jgi:hypothetical protein